VALLGGLAVVGIAILIPLLPFVLLAAAIWLLWRLSRPKTVVLPPTTG